MKNITFTTIGFIVCSLLISCVHKDKVAPVERKPQNVADLIDGTGRALAEVSTLGNFNESNCTDFLTAYTSKLEETSAKTLMPKSREEADFLAKSVLDTVKKHFQIRIELSNIASRFENPSSACVDSLRRALRYSRFIEEYLVEWMEIQKLITPPKEQINMVHLEPHTLVNPKFRNSNGSEKLFELKSGDVLLVRGSSFVSATISRVANEDQQFSHLAMVVEDSQKQLYVAESLIETGVIKYPLSKYLKKIVGRGLVLRHRDPELGIRAGRAAFDYIAKFEARNENIPYDFTMSPDEHSQVYCAELIRIAYELASDNKLIVPKFLTSFSDLRKSGFLTSMGISAEKTFAPGDIEVDPRFEIVAEFRDITNLHKNRVLDVAMTSILDWMQNHDYKLRPDVIQKILPRLVLGLRQMGVAADKIQKHTPPKLLTTVLALKHVTEAIEAEVAKQEEGYKNTNGYFMSFAELSGLVDEIRKSDCKLEREVDRYRLGPPRVREQMDRERRLKPLPDHSLFHFYLAPKSGKCE